MKTRLVRVLVAVAGVSVSFAAGDSLLSGFKGICKGEIEFRDDVEGTATANVKSSRKKNNGALKLRSNLNVEGVPATLVEEFKVRGKRFTYRLVASAAGETTVGNGSGRAKVLKRSLSFKGNAVILEESHGLRTTVRRDVENRELEVETRLTGSAGAVISYDLEKK